MDSKAEMEIYRQKEDTNLGTLSNKSTFYDSNFPTDDIHADKLGLTLQKKCQENLKDLQLNYRGWTKWGAHEIAEYLEETICLERITFRHNHRHKGNNHNWQVSSEPAWSEVTVEEEGECNKMTLTRTLACLLEALALNPNGSMKHLAFYGVTLEWKSALPFCQLLHSTLSLQELTIHGSCLVSMTSDSCLEKLATAFQLNKSLQSIRFSHASGSFLSFLLSQMAVMSPPRLKKLSFDSDLQIATLPNHTSSLNTVGLEALLISSTCRVEGLHFHKVRLDSDHMEALLRGLLNNTTVKSIVFDTPCSLDEEMLGRIFSETACLQHLQLDCGMLQEPTFDGISELQTNTSITKCELMDLKESSGAAIRDVLAHNRTIRSLILRCCAFVEEGEFDFEGSRLDDGDVQLIAEGLKVNRHLIDLSLHQFSIGDADSLQFVAQALCPDPILQEPQPQQSTPIDLSITSDAIADTRLLSFSKVMRVPSCRLRSFRFEFRPSSSRSHEGLLSLLQALEENQSLESLIIESSGDPEESQFLGDWSVMQTFAKSLPKIHSLKRLELDFGMDSESRFNPSGFMTIRADLLTGLAANKSLENLQFGNEMYRTRTPREKGFWTRLSFYGRRNKLIKWLAEENDGQSSLMRRLEYSQSISKVELKTQKPWNLPVWRGFARRTNELNDLSLVYICLRHVPHQLVVSLGANVD